MYPIELSVKQGAWRLFIARKADPAFLAFSEKVWKRDDYACQFCGFQAKEYQEVINLDQNYLNNRYLQCLFRNKILLFAPEKRLTRQKMNRAHQ